MTRVDFLALGAFMPMANPTGEPLYGRTRAQALARRGLLVFVERDEGRDFYQITDAGRQAWEAMRDGAVIVSPATPRRRARPGRPR